MFRFLFWKSMQISAFLIIFAEFTYLNNILENLQYNI